MKVGVGVITMGLREINPRMFGNTETEVFVYTDHEKLGPGHARNQVLSHFDGYDHVFIFDDDCYPLRKGWEKYFLEQAQAHNIHYMALVEPYQGEYVASYMEMQWWRSALGCFIYQDKLAMETIGGYNTAYNRYGFEDAARSRRAINAGLTGHETAWAFPLRGLMYIHSEDVYGENPIPNISFEDKMMYIGLNQKVYQEEVSGGQLFYPYK